MKSNKRKTKVTLKTPPKSHEKDLEEFSRGSRSVLTRYGHKAYEYQCDPINNEHAPRPLRHRSRRGKLYELTQDVEVEIGTAGVGWLVFNPDYNSSSGSASAEFPRIRGPYSDTPIVCHTTAAFSGTTLTNGITTLTGVANVGWTNSKYITNDSQNKNMAWQLDGAAIKPVRESSKFTADGSMTFFQTYENRGCYIGTLPDLTANKTHRTVSGAAFNEDGTMTVIPYKIQSLNGQVTSGVEQPFVYDSNGFMFTNESLAINEAFNGGLIMWLQGTPGSKVRVTLTAGYKLVGRHISPKVHFLANSRDCDIIDNLLEEKVVLGWIGHPERAHQGYIAKLMHFGKKMFSGVEKPLIKELGNLYPAARALWKELGWP